MMYIHIVMFISKTLSQKFLWTIFLLSTEFLLEFCMQIYSHQKLHRDGNNVNFLYFENNKNIRNQMHIYYNNTRNWTCKKANKFTTETH